MKKNHIIPISLIAILIACNCVQMCLLMKRSSHFKTPEDIFSSSIHSVVELKAFDDEGNESFGTAVFIDSDGHLVTNAHVVTRQVNQFVAETFPHIQIRFAFEDEYHFVSVLTCEENVDLAYLSLDTIEGCVFVPAKIGDSSKVKAGEAVYAIGNASNYGLAISAGIVGVPLVNIQYNGYERHMIQCDLTIVAGNSGGALFNQFGDLIGITTFRAKDNVGAIIYGIAYCIPSQLIDINLVKETVIEE